MSPLQLQEMPFAGSRDLHFPGLVLRQKYLSTRIIAKCFLATVCHKYMGYLFTLTKSFIDFQVVKFFGHPEMTTIATRTFHEL